MVSNGNILLTINEKTERKNMKTSERRQSRNTLNTMDKIG